MDPIKQLQEDILAVMIAGRGYSSFELNDLLDSAGKPSYVPTYHFEVQDVQEALGYLVDCHSVYTSQQLYWKSSTEDLQKRFREIREAAIRKHNTEWMMKQHGRIILGYCACCGAIRELDEKCHHYKECIVEPDGICELTEERSSASV